MSFTFLLKESAYGGQQKFKAEKFLLKMLFASLRKKNSPRKPGFKQFFSFNAPLMHLINVKIFNAEGREDLVITEDGRKEKGDEEKGFKIPHPDNSGILNDMKSHCHFDDEGGEILNPEKDLSLRSR